MSDLIERLDKCINGGANQHLSDLLTDSRDALKQAQYLDWTPTAENINALPKPIFEYLCHVETLCDPAGIVAENTLLKDQTKQLDAMIGGLKERIDQLQAALEAARRANQWCDCEASLQTKENGETMWRCKGSDYLRCKSNSPLAESSLSAENRLPVVKWSTETPVDQGWYWYRASSRHHPVPTFIEDCGDGRFRAVEVYEQKMIDVDQAGVEWWPQLIIKPQSTEEKK